MKNTWKSDVLDSSMNGLRRYRQITNSDDTVRFRDVSTYTQVGDDFGANELNEIADEVNISTVSGKTTAEISTSWAIVGVLDKAKSANALNGHFHANNGTCIKWQIYANGNFAITGLSSVASGVFVQDGFMYCTK